MTNVVVHLSGTASHCSQLAHGTRRALDELPDTVLRTLGLRGPIFPSLPANLYANLRIPPAMLSTGSTGMKCGGTQRSSGCQRPFFASRLW